MFHLFQHKALPIGTPIKYQNMATIMPRWHSIAPLDPFDTWARFTKVARDKICLSFSLPFPKRQILDSSKLKEFADDNFNSDENAGKFSEMVENTVGKGEIVHHEQFLLFPECFQKTYTADT